MSTVYEPLKQAIQSVYQSSPPATAAIVVWLEGDADIGNDALNFIYCCDTPEERKRLAALLADALNWCKSFD